MFVSVLARQSGSYNGRALTSAVNLKRLPIALHWERTELIRVIIVILF